MAKLVTNLKCDKCQNGIVTLTVNNVKDLVDISVKGCNTCRESFGIKQVSRLNKIGDPLPATQDHRAMLIKYIDHIVSHEGITFVIDLPNTTIDLRDMTIEDQDKYLLEFEQELAKQSI